MAEFVGPGERALLEDALLALPRRQGAPLRAVIAQADAQFYAKTLPNLTRARTQICWSCPRRRFPAYRAEG